MKQIVMIRSGEEYLESLRGRHLTVYLAGERVAEPLDHPMIRPSINAVAETYDLARRNPELATAISPFTGERVNRFLHIAANREDLVMQNKMQRRLGQLTAPGHHLQQGVYTSPELVPLPCGHEAIRC